MGNDVENSFRQIAELIYQTRQRSLQVINTALIDLYWQVGEYISGKVESAEWGAGVVDQLAKYLIRQMPDLKGFSRPNLFRMQQFYDTYRNEGKVSPLVRQLPWTHNLIIMSRCKQMLEREFYLRLCIEERWSKRELERQLNTSLFERVALNPPNTTTILREVYPTAEHVFKDTYLVDFLNLPESHSEADLQTGLVADLKHFLLELGRDFCFVGEEYLLQVGGRDFHLDLLFYHRELRCLVGFELKIDEFQPEYLGKLEFYLEALDRNVKKIHENPSIGVLLCATKDSEVVEYALSRSLSPALVAEYKIHLPDRTLLQRKLAEFYELESGKGTL